jgi:Protein of unknown function (DUF3396)
MSPLPWGLSIRSDEHAVAEGGTLRADDGRVLGAVALGVTLYIEHGDRPEVREGMLRAYETCLRWTGQAFAWGMDPDSGEPLEVATSSVGDVRGWPAQLLQRSDFQMMFTGASDVDDADPYSFLAVSREREDDELSYLSLTLPLAWAHRHSATDFVALVQELCSLVGPIHGYAGPFLIGHPAGNDDDALAAIYALGEHYRGLEIDMPPHHAAYLTRERRIKGINWITVLGSDLEDRLGGAVALGERLQPYVQRTPFHSSLTQQSGGLLRIGDVPLAGAAGEPMHGYTRTSRELLPVRDTNPAIIWPQGSPGFDFDQASRWMTRFDR